MQSEKFRDLSAKIEKDICSGKLHGRLPGVLRWAGELGVHHVTLTKALRLLAQKKLLEIVPGQGTFVCSGHPVREKYHTIGIVGNVDSLEKSCFLDRMRSLAGDWGYHLVFLTPDPQILVQNPQWLLNFPVDGLLFRFSNLQRRQIDLLNEAGIRFAATFHMLGTDGYDSACNDVASFLEILLKKLKEQNFKHIAFISTGRSGDFQYFLQGIRDCFRKYLGDDFNPDLFVTIDSQQDYYFKYGKTYPNVVLKDTLKTLAELPVVPQAVIMSWPECPCFQDFSSDLLPDTKFYFFSEGIVKPEICCSFPQDESLLWLLEQLIRRCEGYTGPYMHRTTAPSMGNIRGITLKELQRYAEAGAPLREISSTNNNSKAFIPIVRS